MSKLARLAPWLTAAGTLCLMTPAFGALPLEKDGSSPIISSDGSDTKVTLSMLLLEDQAGYLKLDLALVGPRSSTPKMVRVSFYSSIVDPSFGDKTKLSFLIDGRLTNLSRVRHTLVPPSNHNFDAELPLATLLRMATAAKIEGTVGELNFKLSPEQRDSIKRLSELLPLPAVPSV